MKTFAGFYNGYLVFGNTYGAIAINIKNLTDAHTFDNFEKAIAWTSPGI